MASVASGTDWISLVSTRMISTFAFLPPMETPPAALISSRASSAPAQWFSPCTNAIGPRTAILIASWASAADAATAAVTAKAMKRTMGPPRVDRLSVDGRCQQSSRASRPPAPSGERRVPGPASDEARWRDPPEGERQPGRSPSPWRRPELDRRPHRLRRGHQLLPGGALHRDALGEAPGPAGVLRLARHQDRERGIGGRRGLQAVVAGAAAGW